MNYTTKKWLHIIAFIFVIIGALNTFLIGFVQPYNNGDVFVLIDYVFRFSANLRDLVYVLILASAVYLVVTHVKDCKVCDSRK
jgi:uncharacterized membrane protein YuzA (DUF378 family)